MSEPDRSSESLVFVSTGRRLAAAKVGRRWHEVRGPLDDRRRAGVRPGAAAVRGAAHAAGPGPLAPLVRPDRRADDARAGRLAGARARGVRARRAARPGAGGGDPRDDRGRARRRCAAASTRPARRCSPTRRASASATPRSRCATARACSRTSGLGADHHGAGLAAPPGAVDAMIERRVSRLPVGWKHGCDGRDCPLRSAIVAPIMNRTEAVGAIVLFSETALAVSDRDRAIARHLGAPRLDRGHARRARPARARDGLGRARRDAGDDRAALPLQRAQHDRGVLPHAAGRGAQARALVRRALPAQPAPPARVRPAARRAAPRRRVRRARARALRRSARGRRARDARRRGRARAAVARATAGRERHQPRQGRPAAARRRALRRAPRPPAHHRARQRPRHPARARRPRARAGRRLRRRRARPGLGRPARGGVLRRARPPAHRLGAPHRYARLDRDPDRPTRTRAGTPALQ